MFLNIYVVSVRLLALMRVSMRILLKVKLKAFSLILQILRQFR